jgi:hypothetical protein
MDGVDHRFEQVQPIGWQAETSASHCAVLDVTGQAAFYRRDRSLVGVDEAVLGMPAPRCEIGQREFDPSVDLLCVPGGVGEHTRPRGGEVRAGSNLKR